jgi:serine-type D-Ala-D-Ala carboxypeptidase/endopeptidase (penicillin-binding protein 4)
VTVSSFRRLLLVALVALVALGAVAPPASAGLNAHISRILKHYGMGGATVGVSVWREGAATASYSRHAGTLLAPASNEKLLTSTTALCRWGADHRFKTELYLPVTPPASGPVGVVDGDVYIKGYGDPSLSTPSFQKSAFGFDTATLDDFVTELKKSLGVTEITGHIVADDSWFDDKDAVGSWTWGVRSECGGLSGLAVNEGFNGGRRVLDPAKYTARLLTNKLRAAGVAVDGGPTTGVTPDDSYLAVTLLSAPLSQLLLHMDKQSDNFFAETLLKGLGRAFRAEGSTAAGLRVVRATMDTLGMARGDYRIYDGSGLSYSDRVTAGSVAKLLGVMTTRDDYAVFDASLSVAGVDGTLEHRMRNTMASGNFHGKTGTLNIASCLSGYVTSTAGNGLIVSMLMNGRPVDIWAAHQAQDAIAAALAGCAL